MAENLELNGQDDASNKEAEEVVDTCMFGCENLRKLGFCPSKGYIPKGLTRRGASPEVAAQRMCDVILGSKKEEEAQAAKPSSAELGPENNMLSSRFRHGVNPSTRRSVTRIPPHFN